jgi:hypothetical protein
MDQSEREAAVLPIRTEFEKRKELLSERGREGALE